MSQIKKETSKKKKKAKKLAHSHAYHSRANFLKVKKTEKPVSTTPNNQALLAKNVSLLFSLREYQYMRLFFSLHRLLEINVYVDIYV